MLGCTREPKNQIPDPPQLPQTRESDDTLVAVFAHPDDEIFVGPLLARMARQGRKVYLVIVTDGQKGTVHHAKIPAGPALANARTEEAWCSCRQLGIEPPILLGFLDGGMVQGAVYMSQVRMRLQTVLAALKPDVIITWGPEGLYGHMDHRLVSSVVTQVVQRGTAGVPDQLYYFAFPANPDGGGTGANQWRKYETTVKEHLKVATSFEASDFAATYKALQCYRTQYPPEGVDVHIRTLEFYWGGKVYLRPAFVTPIHAMLQEAK